MRVRCADDAMLALSDRAARGASNEVRLIPSPTREVELCLTFFAGMLRERCNVLMCWCGVMMT
jgi:hypothetical protein